MDQVATAKSASDIPYEPSLEASKEKVCVARCLAGDETAAEELVSAHTSLVYGIGLRLSGRVEDAEDLTQEVFLKVFRALGDFRGDCSLRSWIASIAVNASRNRIGGIVRFRKLFVSVEPPLEDPDHDPLEQFPDSDEAGPEEKFLAAERRQLLGKEIAALPREFREAVVLRDQQGLAYEDIALATGVPVGTVRSRLARGRAILAKKLTGALGRTSKVGAL